MLARSGSARGKRCRANSVLPNDARTALGLDSTPERRSRSPASIRSTAKPLGKRVEKTGEYSLFSAEARQSHGERAREEQRAARVLWESRLRTGDDPMRPEGGGSNKTETDGPRASWRSGRATRGRPRGERRLIDVE